MKNIHLAKAYMLCFLSFLSCSSTNAYEKDIDYALSLVHAYRYNESIAMLVSTMASIRNTHGTCNHEYQKASLTLALVYYKCCHLKKALSIATSVIDNARCSIGKYDLIYLQSLLVIGMANAALGKYNASIVSLEKALLGMPQDLNDDELITIAQIQVTLAGVLMELGREEEATALYDKLSIIGSTHNKNMHLKKYIYYAIAKRYEALGQYSRAEKYLNDGELFESGIEAEAERDYKMTLLAKTIIKQHRVEEALEIINKVVDGIALREGESSCRLIGPLQLKAFAMAESDNIRDAYDALKKARNIAIVCYGEIHTDIAEIDIGIASLLYRMGKREDALITLQKAGDMVAKKIGDTCPVLSQILEKAANIERILGEYDAAYSTLARLLAIQKEQYGPDSEMVKDTISKIRYLKKLMTQ